MGQARASPVWLLDPWPALRDPSRPLGRLLFASQGRGPRQSGPWRGSGRAPAAERPLSGLEMKPALGWTPMRPGHPCLPPPRPASPVSFHLSPCTLRLLLPPPPPPRSTEGSGTPLPRLQVTPVTPPRGRGSRAPAHRVPTQASRLCEVVQGARCTRTSWAGSAARSVRSVGVAAGASVRTVSGRRG